MKDLKINQFLPHSFRKTIFSLSTNVINRSINDSVPAAPRPLYSAAKTRQKVCHVDQEWQKFRCSGDLSLSSFAKCKVFIKMW